MVYKNSGEKGKIKGAAEIIVGQIGSKAALYSECSIFHVGMSAISGAYDIYTNGSKIDDKMYARFYCAELNLRQSFKLIDYCMRSLWLQKLLR